MAQKIEILPTTVTVLIVSGLLGGLFGGLWLLFRDPIVTLRSTTYLEPTKSLSGESATRASDHRDSNASNQRNSGSNTGSNNGGAARIEAVSAEVNETLVNEILTEGGRIPVGSNQVSVQVNRSIAGVNGSSPSVNRVSASSFHYGGNATWATLHHKLAPAFQTAWPDFQLRYTHPVGEALSSDTDIKMLLEGQLAFSQSSRPIKPEEYEAAKQRGFSLKQVPVAIDGIAIAINPNLDIPGLTLDELKAIYSGQITNWRQVNGPDLPIIPYSRPVEAGGTPHFFVEKVLGNDRLGNTVVLVDDTPSGLEAVANTLGGIFYASAPAVVTQCSTKAIPLAISREEAFVPPYQAPLIPYQACPTQRNQVNIEAFKQGDYPITRQLFVIVKQDGGLDQQAGEAYAELLLTDEGQQLIREAGFVSIR